VGLRREGISVVSVQKQGRSFALRRAATVDLPAGVLQPSFNEANIAEPQELLAAMREAATSAGLQTQKRWSASLPADSARMSILTLEVAPKTKKELSEVLNWKAERSFGVRPEELRLAIQPLSPDASKRPRYFVVAVRLDVLAEYDELFENLGWQVGLVLPRHLSEAQWLTLSKSSKLLGDSLLVSSQADGFAAMLFRAGQPAVVRSVMCEPEEREDELYRLLLFYRDRLASEHTALDRFLLIGEDFAAERLSEITNETLGYDTKILRPEDIGFLWQDDALRFDDIAAPAALASLALR
jgi:Tfp pilus assembly PilM family ATPase